MSDNFALGLPALDKAAYYSPPPSPPLSMGGEQYSFMTNRGHKLETGRAVRRGRLGTQLPGLAAEEDAFDDRKSKRAAKRRRTTFDIAPNFQLVDERQAATGLDDAEPARAVLPPAPQTPLDLVMSSALHQTLGPKNTAFKSLALSATALIEQEAPLITALRRVCAGLRGEGFEWRREGDDERLAERVKVENDQVRILEEKRLEKDKKRQEERERRRAEEEQERERLEQIEREREEQEELERQRLAKEQEEAERVAAEEQARIEEENRKAAEAAAAQAAEQQKAENEASDAPADVNPLPTDTATTEQAQEDKAMEAPATEDVEMANGEQTPQAALPEEAAVAQPSNVTESEMPTGDNDKPVEAGSEVQDTTPTVEAMVTDEAAPPAVQEEQAHDTPDATPRNDESKDDDTVIEDPSATNEAEGTQQDETQGGDASDSPSEPLRRRSHRVAKRKRSYSRSTSPGSSGAGAEGDAGVGTGTHTPVLGEVVAAEEMPEYVSRLVDPEVYVRSLFVSKESVQMPVIGSQVGGEVLSPNEQEVMLHDCLTDLHRFLADTLEYRDRLSEICNGTLEIERRKKGMYKVVRLVAADWLQEESLADEAAQPTNDL